MMRSWSISKIASVKHLAVFICAISLMMFGISGCDSSQPDKADPVSNTQETDRETSSETQQAQTDLPTEVTDETTAPETGIAEEKETGIAKEEPVEADDGDWPLVYLTFNADGGANDGGETYAGGTGYPVSPDGFEVFAFDTGNVNVAYGSEEGFRIRISDTGSEDWHVQLKKNGIKVENGKWYKVSFDAKSSIARSIVFSMQRDGTADEDWRSYSGTKTVELGSEWKPYAIFFRMTDDTDEKAIYNFALGTVGGKRISQQHTINMKNMRLEMLEDSWTDQLRQGDNLLKNPNFEYEDIGWETAVVEPGAAKVTLENGKAVFDISNVGTLDWNVQLKQNSIPLEKGYNYRLTFKASSTAARRISIGFMDNQFVNWYGGNMEDLSAGAEKTVAIEFYMDKDTNLDACMFISMGKIENVDTPASVITLSDLSLEKLPGRPEMSARYASGGGGDGGSDWTPPTFTLGSWEGSYWGGQVGQRSVVDDGSYLIEILDTGSLEWHVQMQKKGIVLENGKNYKMSFEARSSVDRKISCMLQKDGTSDDVWTAYSGDGGQYQLTDSWQTFTNVFTMTSPTDKNVIYNISLGAVDGRITTPHKVYFRNVKLEEVEELPIESIPVGQEMLTGEWILVNQLSGNSITEKDHVITASIHDLGNNDYDVQVVKKGLTLEEGCTYEFKCFADFDNGQRVIKVGIMQDGTYEWYGGEELEIGRAAGLASVADNEYSFTFTMDRPTIKDGMLAINMGKMEGRETPSGKVTLKDLSLKKISESTEKPDTSGLEMVADVEGNMLKGKELTLSTDGGASAELNGTEIKITNVGSADYHVQLKCSSGLNLEKGAEYEIKADASFKNSDGEDDTRKIIFGFMSQSYDWYGGPEVYIGKDGSPIQATFIMEMETDENAQFVISMGQIEGENTPNGTITLKNISIVKTKDAPVTEDSDLKLIADVEGNMLSGNELTLNTDGGASAELDETGTKITIANVGSEEHHIQLKCSSGLNLEKGAEYEITANASFETNDPENTTRTIKFGLMGDAGKNYDWYGGTEAVIGQETSQIQGTFTMEKETDANAQFAISMGQIKVNQEPISTPTGTITLSNISIVKTKDAPVTEDSDRKLIADVEGNMLKDSGLELSTVEGGAAEQDETGTKITIANVGVAEHAVQLLNFGLNLEQGAAYEIKAEANFEAAETETDKTRTIKFGLMSENYDWYGGTEAVIGQETSQIQAMVTMEAETDTNATFFISMGKIGDSTPTGTITLSNISIVKTKDAPVTEDPDRKLIADVEGNILDGLYLSVEADGIASAELDETGTKITIANVGSEEYHVQLKSSSGLNLEEGAEYEIMANASFETDDPENTTRTIKFGLMDDTYTVWYGGTEAVIGQDSSSIQGTFTMEEATDTNTQFFISMGMIGDSTPTGTITLSDISIVKTKEAPVTDIPDLELIADVEGNMLEDSGLELSIVEGGSAEQDETGTRITIDNVGSAEHAVQLLSFGLNLEEGATYEIKADANFEAAETETADTRTIKFGLMSENYDWYGGGEAVIGQEGSTIGSTVIMRATDANATFFISMGQIEGEDTPTGTITLSDISIVKTKDAPPLAAPAPKLNATEIKIPEKTDGETPIEKPAGGEQGEIPEPEKPAGEESTGGDEGEEAETGESADDGN